MIRRTYNLDRPRDIVQMVARERYAWPGGYPLVAVTSDGRTLCHNCCRTEYRIIRQSQIDYANVWWNNGDGWKVNGYEVAEEGPIYCDHCGIVVLDCWQCEGRGITEENQTCNVCQEG